MNLLLLIMPNAAQSTSQAAFDTTLGRLNTGRVAFFDPQSGAGGFGSVPPPRGVIDCNDKEVLFIEPTAMQ